MSSLQVFDHLRIPIEEIKSITNNFSDENIIGRGGFGNVYKGELLHSGQLVIVAIKRLDRSSSSWQGDKEFWTDISTRSNLKHENLVPIVGYCDEDGEKIIIDKHEVNGSLDKHLSDPNLTWMQRLRICVGIARALRYIHYETNQNYDVIHRNIKSYIVVLDENWEAKIGDFGLSFKCAATRRHRLILDHAVGTIGYVDPVYFESGTVTHKSDVYSLGVVLFEVLCGRIAYNANHYDEQRFLVRMARRTYKSGTMDEIIHPNLIKQWHQESFTIFSETAYNCLKEDRAQRPDMKRVVKRLEMALELQWIHENPVQSKAPAEGAYSDHLKGKDLELLHIEIEAIKFATENFAEKNCIGRGGFGTVYKAKLEHCDLSAVNREEECEVPKRHSIVAIKHIREHALGEEGFVAEIETLTRCKHPNIVSLLGFCYEHPEMYLVYEYVPNGSLEAYLESEDKITNLTWVQRIQICIDIARGLDYMHTTTDNKQKIIHRDIKSANILLDANWKGKIADFGLSKFHPSGHKASTLITKYIAGTRFYKDPEYERTGRLKKATDIYSFGVVLFEILSGRLAHDQIYTRENEKGLAPIARQHFDKGTLIDIVDPKLKEETGNIFTLSNGPNQNSLHTFSKIAYQCLEETQAQRPTMIDIINELEKALEFEKNSKDNLKLSLEDIKLATQNFSDHCVIGYGGFGKIYKGEVTHTSWCKMIALKRLDISNTSISGQGENEFMTELEILLEYKHDNIICLVGYCDEMNEKIIAYEYYSRGGLDRWLNDDGLTWVKRLRIGIAVASGLEFLHGGDVTKEVVIHRDIKSSNILLNEDWEAKITNFGLSLITTINHDVDYVIEDGCGTYGYVDLLYIKTGMLTKQSDIYSFGVVLCEILCGMLIYKADHRTQYEMLKHHYEDGKVSDTVFEGIKEQILPQSLAVYADIAYQCLQHDRAKRPTASEVVVQLKKALEIQEDYDIWEPKLPKDYQEIIQMSKSPKIYSTMKKQDLYNMFSRGIVVQHDKVLSFEGYGERNEMISATTFSYINRCPYKWRSLPESRFEKVAEMLDTSNLMIEIHPRTQFLSPNTVYGIHLVFKFRDSRKFSSKPMYVNLKYKKGRETFNSYFATWRDEEWMMIELYRFLNDKEDVVFEFLLESLSTCYHGDGVIYVEGIEFRAINNVEHQGIEELKEVQQVLKFSSILKVQQLPTKMEEISTRFKNYYEGQKFFCLSDVNGKKLLILSAKAALNNFSDSRLFKSKSLVPSRFGELIELRPQHIFCINCTITGEMLSPDTEYVCYLVFKLLKDCEGLRSPVKVQNLLHGENKENEMIYLAAPSPWNIHDVTEVPKQKEDGWMEISLWKFNSNIEREDDCIPVSLKLISYEGNFAGLVVCSLEFRPV